MRTTVPVATTDFPTTPALTPADAAAHRAASYVRSTRTEVRTRISQDTIIELSSKDARTMSSADFDRLATARAELDKLTTGNIR